MKIDVDVNARIILPNGQHLRLSNGSEVSGYGTTVEEAVSKLRDEVEEYLGNPDRDALRMLFQ